jgi:crotonobetainyl-CoA:carnitine CoA-transferase CaiB-like acyl-CoA transferase
VKNRAVLVPELGKRTRAFTRADLLARLEARAVPSGPVNNLADTFADPQVIARGLRVDLPCPDAAAGSVPSVRGPIVMDGAPLVASRPSPGLGAHQDEVSRDPGWGGDG